MKKYDMKNALTIPWHRDEFYIVDGISLAYHKDKWGNNIICPYGEQPMTRYQLESRGHTVVPPKVARQAQDSKASTFPAFVE